MGKKLKISNPMVLDVMLAPFTESFDILKSDTEQQWYYANTGVYMPNRATNPLVLSPQLSVFDPDTNETYTPTFADPHWFYLDPENGTYNERGQYVGAGGQYVLITTSTAGYAFYWTSQSPDPTDARLIVTHNTPYNEPETLLCVCPYIDPRSAGTSYTVSSTVILTTGRDADQEPVVVINNEPFQKFDLFKRANSQYTFTAKVMKGGEDVTRDYEVRWYVQTTNNGAEVLRLIDTEYRESGILVKTFPFYVSGQGTSTLVIDAMYTEKVTIAVRAVSLQTHVPYNSKAYATLVWDDIPIDPFAHSLNSGGVRSNTKNMDFDMIVNLRGKVLSEQEKSDNLRINWKRRNKSNGANNVSVVDLGWGQQKRLNESTLKATDSQLVYGEVYIAGAYEKIYYQFDSEDELVTYNFGSGDEPVFHRF